MTAPPTRLYRDALSRRDKLRRLCWQIAQACLFRPTPAPGFHRWRIALLRLFGAQIGQGCKIYPTARVWAPWNLQMGNRVAIAAGVDCYNVSPIRLNDYSTVSQRTFLCTASHDISELSRPLVHSPIRLAKHAWVCAEAFVGPGVTLGEGAVLAARGVATRDIPPWEVHGGTPNRKLFDRVIKS